jgi:CRP/FNR family transcriptional regulator, cyclic AMP receptor protein
MTVLRDDTIAYLRRSPLFQGVDDERLAAMCERFSEGVFRPGHLILEQGRPGMEFFLILDGTAEVLVDGRVIATLGADDFFGEVAALREGTHTASVRATSQLRCLYLSNGKLHGFLLDYPELAVTILHRVVRRLRTVVTSAETAPGT